MVDDLKARATTFAAAVKAAPHITALSAHLASDRSRELMLALDQHLPAWARRIDALVAETTAVLDRKAQRRAG